MTNGWTDRCIHRHVDGQETHLKPSAILPGHYKFQPDASTNKYCLACIYTVQQAFHTFFVVSQYIFQRAITVKMECNFANDP